MKSFFFSISIHDGIMQSLEKDLNRGTIVITLQIAIKLIELD